MANKKDTVINVSENEADLLRRMYRSIYTLRENTNHHTGWYPSWVITILTEEWYTFKKVVTLIYPDYISALFKKPFEDVPLIPMITKPVKEIEYYAATIKWRLSIGK